jgi:Uma2 family endonuclease
MSTVAEQIYTPEDLLAMPNRKKYELVDGHLVERRTSLLSNWMAGSLHRFIDVVVDERQLGWAWPAGQGYVCFPESPRMMRIPDVSFVSNVRLPKGPTSEGYIYIAPDLAVEVVSPNDTASEVLNKVLEYLDAGVALVWVIDPEELTAQVYRRDGSTRLVREDGELSGEEVLPGFCRKLTTIFPAKAAGKPERG